MTPIEQAALEATIVAACTEHQVAHWQDIDYRPHLFIEPGYFVKYGNYKFLWLEIATQLYISRYAESHAGAPRIPKIVHHFQGDQGRGYLVMEYIKFRSPSPSDLPERAAVALKWLSEVPAPSGHVLGPLGGGYIRHKFFKDGMAPLVFTSTEALERYVNKVRPWSLLNCIFSSIPISLICTLVYIGALYALPRGSEPSEACQHQQ